MRDRLMCLWALEGDKSETYRDGRSMGMVAARPGRLAFDRVTPKIAGGKFLTATRGFRVLSCWIVLFLLGTKNHNRFAAHLTPVW